MVKNDAKKTQNVKRWKIEMKMTLKDFLKIVAATAEKNFLKEKEASKLIFNVTNIWNLKEMDRQKEFNKRKSYQLSNSIPVKLNLFTNLQPNLQPFFLTSHAHIPHGNSTGITDGTNYPSYFVQNQPASGYLTPRNQTNKQVQHIHQIIAPVNSRSQPFTQQRKAQLNRTNPAQYMSISGHYCPSGEQNNQIKMQKE